MSPKNRQAGIIYYVLGAVMLLVTILFIAPNSGNAADTIILGIRDCFSSDKNTFRELSFDNTDSEKPPVTESEKIDSVAVTLTESEETTLSEFRSEDKEKLDVYSTPSDITAMKNDYVAAFSASKPAGKVTECFFTDNGATDNVGNIYIKNTTTEKPNFKSLTDSGFTSEIKDYTEPTVLIFHTHTTESYLMADNGVFYDGYKTRSVDPTRNMVRVGDEICRRLEKNGIGVIHDTRIYDDTYNGAYARSRKSVFEYLKQYPSIKIVLDVHRDAVYTTESNHLKAVCEIDGRKAAQVMIITGAQGGPVESFPHWNENLRFALALQKRVQDEYNGLMKPLYFCYRRYNMDVTPCSLLLEFGTDANTLDEAMYSASMLGEALSGLIKDNVIAN